MNREIKFRQKTIDGNGNKCFHFWGFMPNGEFITPIISENGTYWTALENSEQYTGLKDKNGKEIYEGDIVRSMQYVNIDDEEKREFIEVVKFEGGEFFPVCEEPGKDYEVIGNIYENPGLLNK